MKYNKLWDKIMSLLLLVLLVSGLCIMKYNALAGAGVIAIIGILSIGRYDP